MIFSGQLPPYNVKKDWITMDDECVKGVKGQVQIELKAAMTYLSMVRELNAPKNKN